jgi:hypothetical protein
VGISEEYAPLGRVYIESLTTSMVNIFDKKYTLISSFNPIGTYSLKHGYLALILEHVNEPIPWWSAKLWKLKCLTKSKLCMWLLLKKKIPYMGKPPETNFCGTRSMPTLQEES